MLRMPKMDRMDKMANGGLMVVVGDTHGTVVGTPTMVDTEDTVAGIIRSSQDA